MKVSHNNAVLFSRNHPSKAQQQLLYVVRDLFPEELVLWNFRDQHLTYETSGARIELDIFVPFLSLALEYQGSQHYRQHFQFGNPSQVQRRDEEKLKICNEAGITLVLVPYWWDTKKQSLMATIAVST